MEGITSKFIFCKIINKLINLILILQSSLYKAFRFNKPRNDKPIGSSTSPTPSYSSSEGGIYATIGSIPPPTTAPPPPPSHRVSAPPMESNSTLPRYAQHRRVKSISDIEVISAT